MMQSAPQNQLELFSADATWFHVFRAMIDSGDLARMSGSSVKVYLVVKAHANFKTGRAYPALETIAMKAGLSLAQVKREMKTLEELGHLTKTKIGRCNEYRLKERVQIMDGDGHPSAIASWDYLPGTVQHAVEDLKKGLDPHGRQHTRIVNIERLQVQIVQGNNNSAIQINNDSNLEANLIDLADSNPDVFDKLMKMWEGKCERRGEEKQRNYTQLTGEPIR